MGGSSWQEAEALHLLGHKTLVFFSRLGDALESLWGQDPTPTSNSPKLSAVCTLAQSFPQAGQLGLVPPLDGCAGSPLPKSLLVGT